MTAARESRTWRQIPLWAAGSSLAGAAIGLAVAFFRGGPIEPPILVISVLLANVVGLTAMIGSVGLFPRLQGLSPALRFLLLGLALASGAAVGSVAVLASYPLFVFREPRLAAAVVAINGILALIVGAIVYSYETLRLRLEGTLREMEEVRLVQARLREEAARAELAALQARINPHFFFNTLNTIAGLLDDDPAQAAEVVETLGDLFRYTFKVSDAEPVALAEEVEFVRGYLRIETARFGSRLRVLWDVAPQALALRVPGLILQPLVENAVGHGLAPRAAGGTVRIAACVREGRLRLEVEDDGVGPRAADGPLAREGHGLANVRRRLGARYGEQALLTLSAGPGGRGALACVELPAAGGAEAGA
jgi:sensor histidine kinase YesM